MKPTGKFLLGVEVMEDVITQCYYADTNLGHVIIRFLPCLHKKEDNYWSATLLHKTPDWRWADRHISFKDLDFETFLMKLQSFLLGDSKNTLGTWDMFDESAEAFLASKKKSNV